MKDLRSYETSVLTRTTRRNNPEDAILQLGTYFQIIFEYSNFMCCTVYFSVFSRCRYDFPYTLAAYILSFTHPSSIVQLNEYPGCYLFLLSSSYRDIRFSFFHVTEPDGIPFIAHCFAAQMCVSYDALICVVPLILFITKHHLKSLSLLISS
jgi:hypothetical protein